MGEKGVPQVIYGEILDEIENLLHSLSKSDEDGKADDYRRDAITKLSGLKNEVVKNIKFLKENSDWDTFTVAFYGETNAGKSTLIESLRILLKEKKKLEEHRLFRVKRLEMEKLIQEINDLKKNINSLENKNEISKAKLQFEINKIQENLEQECHVAKVQIVKYEKLIKRCNVEDEMISEEITTYLIQKNLLHKVVLDKMLASTWSIIKSWFHHLDEQKEIEKLNPKIEELKQEANRVQSSINEYQEMINIINLEKEDNIKKYNFQQSELLNHIGNLEIQKENQMKPLENKIISIQTKQNNLITELKKLGDGAIVGDGRSDFTQEVEAYQFSLADKNFVILDLPGIEGKEEIVRSSIDRAVEKAHAIFYISKKPTPPQKGDNETLGTIEKISKQLSKQSEVYFIYNKPVRNPRQLKKSLIDQGDEDSLLTVDEVLTAVLDENYVTHLSLSAYPAFLALGNFYSGKYSKDQKKFTQKFEGTNQILELSRVHHFANWMTRQLVNNVEDKIVRSNYKKIKVTLDTMIKEIGKIQTAFEKLEETMQSNFEYTSSKLDNLGEVYIKNIMNSGHRTISDLKMSIRKRIYEDIAKEISDEEFEEKLNLRVKEEITNYTNNLTNKMDRNGKEFTSGVVDIVSTYQRYVEELVSKYVNLINVDFDFKLQIDIKKNIDIKETVITVIGNVINLVFGILNIGNPLGWVALGLSVLSVLIGTYKKFRAFVDKEFHKSQQRKSANENIDKVIENIENQLDEQLSGVRREIFQGISVIKEKLEQPVIQIETMTDTFLNAKNNMNQLSIRIVKEEEEQYENN